MAFEQTERIIAVAADAVGTLFPDLLNSYGEYLNDGPRRIKTIGAFYGDAARTVMGAASLADGTIAPQVLTDSRLAFRCLWQADLAAAFDEGAITGVEELTEEQLAALLPQPEEIE
jgi:hypothetical protein